MSKHSDFAPPATAGGPCPAPQQLNCRTTSRCLPSFRQADGFTLIELVVVTTLIALMLFIAIPRFRSLFATDDLRTVSRWLMAEVPLLKNTAITLQQDVTLNIDLDSQHMWVTHADMNDEQRQAAAEKDYQPPEAVQIRDVEFAGGATDTSGQVAISFYRQGYSDQVIIHLTDSAGRIFSLKIEPFLPRPILYSREVEFENRGNT